MPTIQPLASSLTATLARGWLWLQCRLLGWGRIFYLGAVVAVLILSPASYSGPQRQRLLCQMYRDTAPVLAAKAERVAEWNAILSA